MLIQFAIYVGFGLSFLAVALAILGTAAIFSLENESEEDKSKLIRTWFWTLLYGVVGMAYMLTVIRFKIL